MSMQPMEARTRSSCSVMLNPFTHAVPLVGRRRVVRHLIRVVFPAPFGPRRPNTSPSRMSRLTSVSAWISFFRFGWPRFRSFETKVFVRSSTLMMGSAMENGLRRVRRYLRTLRQRDHVRGRAPALRVRAQVHVRRVQSLPDGPEAAREGRRHRRPRAGGRAAREDGAGPRGPPRGGAGGGPPAPGGGGRAGGGPP